MKALRNCSQVFPILAIFLLGFIDQAYCQDFPTKPITIYVGFAAGASTYTTARMLGEGIEKMFGVPVVVESKPGGASTVCAGLLASKKPDGYTLAVITAGALTLRSHLVKVGYNPLKDFTFLMQYSRYIGGLCVLNESPLKTIEQFIEYARANPGLSFGSPGIYSQQSLAMELLAQCKGLKFKHVPFKGGIEVNTALLGKHTDFLAGNSHIPYVRQGLFRMLLVFNTDKREPAFPGVPMLKELSCGDAPASGVIILGPKGLPSAICKKLGESFKKITDGADFQKVLASFEMPYDYKDQEQLEKEIPAEYEWYMTFLNNLGIKKKG